MIKLHGEDLNIVIRPHPSENIQIYETLFKGFDNVSIDCSTPLKYQIERADAVVVGSGSTTAIESAQWALSPSRSYSTSIVKLVIF